jgi:predicted dehydrogenase
VLDWGIHMLDQLLDLIPEKVVSVYAHLHYINNKEVDDNFTAALRFAGGTSAAVTISMNCFILQPRWHMCCEDGTAVIENWELDGRIVKLADTDEMDWTEDIVYTAAGPTRSMIPRPKETTLELPLPAVKGEWTEYYRNICDVLNGKAEPIVTMPQLLRVMNVVDAIFESSATGKAITANI